MKLSPGCLGAKSNTIGYCHIGYDFEYNDFFDADERVFDRLATEEEKAKLFQAINDNGYKWNDKTKTLEKLKKLSEPKFKIGDRIKKEEKIATIIEVSENYYYVKYDNKFGSFAINLQDEWELLPNKFDINTLKPFDKVLVRDVNNQKWGVSFYSHYNEDSKYPFVTVGNAFCQCIPYNGNEYLSGTTKNCDDFYKIWKE